MSWLDDLFGDGHDWRHPNDGRNVPDPPSDSSDSWWVQNEQERTEQVNRDFGPFSPGDPGSGQDPELWYGRDGNPI